MQVHVFYGDGKGKTSAALGQALRSWGTGWSVLFAQFLKDASAPAGEVDAAEKLGTRWRHLRAELPCSPLKAPGKKEKALLQEAVDRFRARAAGEIDGGTYDVIVLDEILAAWKLGLVRVAAIRELLAIAGRSGARLAVLTGRWAPASILAAADLVTEVRKVRHPFDTGRKASRGIDY